LFLPKYLSKAEHIKFPESKSQNFAQPVTHQQQQDGGVTRKSSATPQGQASISITTAMNPSEIRSMSPVPGQQPAEEEIRRAMSPPKVVSQSIKPTNGMPAVDDYGHGSRGGSASGDVNADLVRELETVRRQMLWMKEVLGKAIRAGYVYVDRDGNQDLDETFDDESDRGDTAQFKQFKEQMQVRYKLCTQ
jgi:hypothetical protein